MVESADRQDTTASATGWMRQARHRLHRQRTTPMRHKYQEQIAALCPIGQYKCPRGRTEAFSWGVRCCCNQFVYPDSLVMSRCLQGLPFAICFISSTKKSSKWWGGPAEIHHLTSQNSSKSHKLITKTVRGKHSKLHHHHLDLLKTLGKK